MYLGIIFAVSQFGGDTFTLSREFETDDKKTLYHTLKAEGKLSDDDIDTILVVESGVHHKSAPEVIHHWTAGNGDFDFGNDTTADPNSGLDTDDD